MKQTLSPNEQGQKFIDTWLRKGVEILESRRVESLSRKGEYFIAYKHDSDNKVCFAVVSMKGEQNDGSCFFGDIEHFAKVWTEAHFGYKSHSFRYRDYARCLKALRKHYNSK